MSVIQKSRQIMKELVSGKEQALEEIEAAIESGEFNPEEISIAAMAAEEFGSQFASEVSTDHGMEDATPAIKSSQLSRFVQTVLRNALMRECPREEYHLQNLIRTVEVAGCDEGDKVVGLFDDFEAKDLCEGEEYPFVGVDTDYEDLPSAAKFGFRVAMTRELLCRHSATINLFRTLSKVRRALDAKKEDKLYDAVLGVTPLYSRTGTLWQTYYEALGVNNTPFGDTGPWENAQQNPFCGFDDLEESNVLADNMVDLKTGAPCPVSPSHILTSRTVGKRMAVRFRATSIESVDPCDAGAKIHATPTSMLNDVVPTVVTSRQRFTSKIMSAYSLTQAQAAEWWLHFSPDAIEWWSHWDEVTQCDAAESGCARDIPLVYKASSRGMAVMNSPQRMIMNTN